MHPSAVTLQSDAQDTAYSFLWALGDGTPFIVGKTTEIATTF